jgi:hypothetical protein
VCCSFSVIQHADNLRLLESPAGPVDHAAMVQLSRDRAMGEAARPQLSNGGNHRLLRGMIDEMDAIGIHTFAVGQHAKPFTLFPLAV